MTFCPDAIDQALREGMESLVFHKRMLTGLAVAYGTARKSAGHMIGLAQEVTQQDGRFVPDEKPLHAQSLYDIASLTKLFSLVALLQLAQARKLRLTDTLGRWDKRFAQLTDVSLYDLITYRARIESPGRLDQDLGADTLRRRLFACTAQPLTGGRLYSDMNALIVKYVVEAASGMAFDGYLNEHILKPLSMADTFFRVPADRLCACVNYNFEHRWQNGRAVLLTDSPPGTPHDPKARLLAPTEGLSGHAGLFSTLGDMVRFAQGLLSGALISPQTLKMIGVNRTGYLKPDGRYRQYMGMIAFSKSSVPRLSEVPPFMGPRAFGTSGYTGHHLAIDPEAGVFDLFLGNRCHNRLCRVEPGYQAKDLGLSPGGEGQLLWPDGRRVYSSYQYVYYKDALLHGPVSDALLTRGWLSPPRRGRGHGI